MNPQSKNELAQKIEVYAKSVAHDLVVPIAEMYATGIEVIFPAGEPRPEPDAPAILRFPTRV